MPDFDDDDQELFGAPEGEDDRFKEMRKAANKAAKLSKENAAQATEIANLKRDVAFTKAGLDLSPSKQTALLAAHGDGELTAEALRATAIDLGFAQAAEASAEDQQRETALQAHAQIAAAQAGSTPPTAIPKLDEQIRTAEQAGEWTKARQLKANALVASMLGAKT